MGFKKEKKEDKKEVKEVEQRICGCGKEVILIPNETVKCVCGNLHN